jgi:transglutaminase-like putative cysteine protease
MNRRLLPLVSVTVVAAALAWFSLWSWRGLIAEPHRFLIQALVGTVLVAVTGVLGRWRLRHWYLVLPIQLFVVFLWLQQRLSGRGGLMAWIPTPAGIAHAARVVVNGAQEVNTYPSPVTPHHVNAAGYLVAVAMLVVLGVDLLACGLRRAPWAGLPVVVALTVPISVLDQGLSAFVFLLTALLFVLLLATEESDRVRAWAQQPERGRRDSATVVDSSSSVRSAALRVGLITAAGALILPVLVPVTHGFLGNGNGAGDGPGRHDPIKLVNPIIDLHRDLISQNHVPLLNVRTDDRDPGYVRLTVLDEFDGTHWKPSERNLPAANRAGGALPRPPGLTVNAPGTSAEWTLELTPEFHTAWLPAPYPLTALRPADGDWRFDARTMDFANVDDHTPVGLAYTLTAFHPAIDPADLDSAPQAPRALVKAMTALPGKIPPVVEDTARTVTESGTTAYQKAVLLQDWFRRSGGFVYSLTPDTGSATDALVRFITTDKVGYCEQFAAAMAIMARSLGIPARVVVGFLAPEDAGYAGAGTYLYTSDALHAWPEIYFPGSGWVRFEPTPSTRTGRAPAWTVPAARPTTSASPTPTSTSTDLLPAHAPTPENRTSTPASRQGGSTAAAWGVALLVLLLVGLIPGLVRRRQRHRRLRPAPSRPADAVALGLWTELLATADDLGIVTPEARSVRRVAHALAAWVGTGVVEIGRLDELVTFVERARYGRAFIVEPSVLAEMEGVVRQWSELLRDSVSGGRRIVAKVAPRSVWMRRDAADLGIDLNTPQQVGAGEVR